MGLDVMATPDSAHAGLADPLRLRHRPATPLRAAFGLGLQSGVDDGLDTSRIVTGFPASSWRNLPKRLDPAALEPLAPEANRLTVHVILSGGLHLRLATSKRQDDATA